MRLEHVETSATPSAVETLPFPLLQVFRPRRSVDETDPYVKEFQAPHLL